MKAPEAVAGASTGVVQGSAALDDLLSRTSITEIARTLGLEPDRCGRCRATYRAGRSSTSLSLDDRRGVWYDHGTGRGGGVLALIQAALGCDRRAAVAWLADYHGVTLGRTDPTSARRLAARRESARARATHLVLWRNALVMALRGLRNQAWDAARSLDAETVCANSDDPATWASVAAAVQRRRAGDVLDGYIALLVNMGAHELADLRARLESVPVRRAA